MKIRIKIQGVLLIAGFILIIAFSNFLFQRWQKKIFDEVSDFIGIGLILFGFLFRTSARGYKEEKCRNGKALVKDGPYAIVRNPMYLGTFLIGAGVVVALLQAWTFLIFAAVFFMIYMPQMKKEENALLGRFGDEYREYCSVTPKHIPNFMHTVSFFRHFSLKYFWVKKEAGPFFALISAVIIIEAWEDSRLFGSGEILAESFEQVFIVLFFTALIGILTFKKKKAS